MSRMICHVTSLTIHWSPSGNVRLISLQGIRRDLKLRKDNLFWFLLLIMHLEQLIDLW